MKKILFGLLVLISVQLFGQNPPGYQSRIVRERIQGSFMIDSTLHIPRYNGTPSGVRGGGSVQDGALAIDTTNHILYKYSGGAWSQVGFTYTANLPIRVTGTVISADTSVAYSPSLTTNARVQKVLDSLNLVEYNFSGLANWDLLRYNSSSSEFVNYKSTFIDSSNAAIKVLVRDTVTGQQYHTNWPMGIGSTDSLLYYNFQTSQYDTVPQAGDYFIVSPEFEDYDDIAVYREGSFQYLSTFDGITISNDTMYFYPSLSDSERVNIRIIKERPVRQLHFAPGLLLDDYSGALVAYSLRQLRTGQTNCIRVRRGSDNAEQDIGFIDGELDVASLTSFIGGGDAAVVTWYDQSGNGNDANMPSSVNQPSIISSGTLQETNGKPTINFGTDSEQLALVLPTGLLNGATSLSYFHVANVIDFASSNAGVFGPATSNSTGIEVLQSTVSSRRTLLRINGTARNDNSGAGYQLWDDATQSLTSIFGNSTDMSAYKNSSAVTLTSSAAMPSLNFNGVYAIGYYNSGTTDMYGNIQELIIYSTNQASNRTGIELNINSFYTIY